MAQRRRIVPDASVLLPAYFPKRLKLGAREIDLTRRSWPIMNAIQQRHVLAFAPPALLIEFCNVAMQKGAAWRGSPAVSWEQVDLHCYRFISLPITYQPAEDIAAMAWSLARQYGISSPDSWYVACALHYDAELWISHAHADGLVDHARRADANIHVLVDESFDRPS